MAAENRDARARLLAAAGRLFRRQGYTATGVKQLLDDSGSVAGSFYHHFPGGKEEVARHVVRRAGAGIAGLLAAALADAGSVRAAFDGWIAVLVRTMADSDGLDGCPIAPIAAEAPAVGPALRREASDQFRGWAEIIAAGLREEGHDERAAHRLSLVVLAALEGALLLDRAAADTTALQALRDSLPALLPDPPEGR